MTEKDQFDVARELIRHEDGLVNNRVTWLLVLQGFLFTAFVNGVGLYQKTFSRSTAAAVTIGLALICLFGIVSSLVVLNVVQIAFAQMEKVKTWWKKTGLSESFPPVSGELPAGWFYFLFSAGRMPFFLIGIWSVMIVLLVYGVQQ